MLSEDFLRDILEVDEIEVSSRVLMMYEKSAVKIVEKETGNYFGEPVEEVSVVEGTGIRNLWLPYEVQGGDVSNITSVTYKLAPRSARLGLALNQAWFYSGVISSTEWTVFPATFNYILKYSRKLERLDSSWFNHDYVIKVEYKKGYPLDGDSESTAPDDVKMLISSIVGYFLNKRGMEGFYKFQTKDTQVSLSDSAKNDIPFWDSTIESYNIKPLI